MPLPLLFIGIAAATGGLGVGKTIKAGIDANNAKKINKNANEIVEASTEWLTLREWHAEILCVSSANKNYSFLTAASQNFLIHSRKSKMLTFVSPRDWRN